MLSPDDDGFAVYERHMEREGYKWELEERVINMCKLKQMAYRNKLRWVQQWNKMVHFRYVGPCIG